MRMHGFGSRQPATVASDEQDVAEAEVIDPKLKSILEESDRPSEGLLFCTACSHVIGHVNDRIEVNGSFEHSFTNPYGFRHRFGCHREAHGCAIAGEPQAADSWFPGFRWRLASCGGCGVHMGWLFEREDAHFFGLILDRIQAG